MSAPRVLYLAPDMLGPPGGIARYCRMVWRAIDESGNETSVLALNDQPPPEGRADDAGGPVPRLYQACGGSRKLFARRALASALRWHPTHILVGHPNFGPLAWAIARLVRARLLAFVYGIEVWEPLSRARQWTLQRAERVISISRFTARQAVEVNGVSQERMAILNNCLDPHFQRPASVAVRPSGMSMLTVARMSLAEQYKGHDLVIRALPALLARFPQLVYDVVGDGDWRPELEALAAREGVTGAARFHGIVSEDELTRRYREATLFIMPSRAEGFGFVFLEAMSQGLPAIGGNMDATPEVIVDGKTGYTVDPTSPEAIVQAVSRLLEDDAHRQRMGEAAIAHVEREFSFQRFQKSLLTLLS